MEEIVVEQVCDDCGKTRTNEPEYSALQALTGQPLGWYSGDDGEICPADMAKLMNMSNRTTRYEGWSA